MEILQNFVAFSEYKNFMKKKSKVGYFSKMKKIILIALTSLMAQNWKPILEIWLFNHLSMYLGVRGERA